MSSTHKSQTIIVKRLYSHRNSVYRCLSERRYIVVGNIVGDDLDSNLIYRRAVEEPSSMFDKALNLRRVQQRRCAAAKVYCSNISICQKTTLLIQLSVHHLDNIREVLYLYASQKVAVAA